MLVGAALGVGLLGLSLGTAGCQSGPDVVSYARTYPPLAQQGSLDIQVVRRVTKIELTNTTARAFGNSTLWLNGRFSLPIDGFGVGETLTLNLRDFRDEFSDAFRAGGFFASETPDRLVLAQIETPRVGEGPEGAKELLGLVVVKGDAE